MINTTFIPYSAVFFLTGTGLYFVIAPELVKYHDWYK